MAGAFFRAVGAYVDHWAAADISNGDIVVLGDGLIGLALSDIPRGTKGALSVQGVWEVPLVDGHTGIDEGEDLYWDEDGTREDAADTDDGAATTDDDSGNNPYLGKAVIRDSALATDDPAVTGDFTVWVRVVNGSPD